MTAHHTFRRHPWQQYLRCLSCGYVARKPGAHVAHSLNANKAGETP